MLSEKAFNKQFTQDFDLFTLCYSETAERRQILNLPTENRVIDNLELLATRILQPIVDHFKLPLFITSGYRGPVLNQIVGGVPTSQHQTGQAADVLVGGLHSDELAFWILENLDFDELILERFDPLNREYGWVHCSYIAKEKNRKKVETFDGKQYFNGLFSSLPRAT